MSCGHCGAGCRRLENWTDGKTRESVDFVLEAEDYLETATDPKEVTLLEKRIRSIKSGEVVLLKSVSVAEFLFDPR